MLFRFRNIGKIAEADIEINGLTVLGGHNDTGKSTIGKTLYAIIKTIKNSEIEYRELKKEQINSILSRFDTAAQKKIGFPLSLRCRDFKSEKEIVADLSIQLEEMKSFLLNELMLKKEIFAEIDILFQQYIEKIIKISLKNLDDTFKHKNAFTRTNISLFEKEFINKKYPEIPAEITCNDSEKDILKIATNKNSTKKFILIEKFAFDDVVLVESPALLSQPEFLHLDIQPDYNSDLIQKLHYAVLEKYESINDIQNKLISYIKNIVDGRLYYDNHGGDFIFERDQNISIKSINIASGIKAFGIIQLLIISGAINPNTLLIIDEPEVHLHPEWQLKYAKLITLLVDSGVYVLISSHSPYMIEALKVYSDKLKLDKITRFYVGNVHEKGTVFQDVTEDMEPLFHQLAFPMQKLTFEA